MRSLGKGEKSEKIPSGLGALFRKELADHLESKRFTLVFLLMFLAAVMSLAGAISTNGRGIVSEDLLPGNRFDAANLILAREIQSRLYTATGGPDRGVRFARFRV